MKYPPLWQLLSNYRVEHTLISLIGTCHCICPHCFARPIQQHRWFCKFRVVGRKPEFILAGNFVYVFLDKNIISQHKTQPLLHLTHIGQWGISPTDTLMVTDASDMLNTSSLMDGVGVQTLTSRTGAWNGWFIEHSRIIVFLYVRCNFSLVETSRTPSSTLNACKIGHHFPSSAPWGARTTPKVASFVSYELWCIIAAKGHHCFTCSARMHG